MIIVDPMAMMMMMKKMIMQMRRSSRMVVSSGRYQPFYYVLSVNEDMGADYQFHVLVNSI
jgi:hypothetical protein